MRKRGIALLLFVALCATLCAAPAFADDGLVDWESLCVYGDAALENTKIGTQEIAGETCLVLPSNLSPEAVPLGLTVLDASAVVTATGAVSTAVVTDGGTLNLTALCGEGTRYALTLRATDADGATEERTLTVLRSANVAAMYLVSDDPAEQGRAWVESSPDKSNKATGAMVLQDAAGETVYDNALTQIKGRGNSTWQGEKKPYQIKLKKKTDLLQSGDAANVAKTWVLLANYNDAALLRNTVALGLGAELGMDSSIESRFVDLYYDGEYRGSYLLTEKVEVGDGRVDIADLEEANEAANPDVEELDALDTAVGTTENGATYTYCVGMDSPEDITGGYLLEMEVAYRTASEICYFYTTRGNYVVVKSPECASQAEMDYIASLYQEYEDALYNGGVNPATGKAYTDYVDLQSTVDCYLVNELSKNLDGFRTSAFLYKDAGSDQMRMGPLWDYDLGFGIGGGTDFHVAEQRNPEGLYTARSSFAGQLYELADFRVAVRETYESTLYPLLRDVLLGDASAVGAAGRLRSFEWYRATLAQSAACDAALWRGGDDWGAQLDFLTAYLEDRSAWLRDAFSAWNADSYEPLSVYLDVDVDAWYYDEVQAVTEYGLMQGTAISVFSPDEYATRAQVTQVLYNMTSPGLTACEQVFSDVSPQKWYGVAIYWGVQQGIVAGYPDGTFRPDELVSRQEFVALLYRHAGRPETTGDETAAFSDVGALNAYARDAMEWAVEQGIVTGYPDDTLRPRGSMSRAEMAAMLLRYYEGCILTQAS